MPDAVSATDLDLEVNFSKGDRVLVRAQPLLRPMVVDHITGTGRLVCVANESPGQRCAKSVWLRRYQQWELVACPDGYEPALSSEDPILAATLAASWVHCNWRLL